MQNNTMIFQLHGWTDEDTYTHISSIKIHIKIINNKFNVVAASSEESTKGFTCIAVFLEYVEQCANFKIQQSCMVGAQGLLYYSVLF